MAPHVHVLMATYNGAAHLHEQLRSFEAQTHGDWSLWVSDDGSSDATGRILADYARERPGRVHIFEGPRRGSAANFLSLMARPELPEGIVALADQDDVWLPHRLERGLEWLSRGDGRPTVYASRTIRVTEDLDHLSPSIDHGRAPVFANALVQNILAGNTLILDGGALRLLRETVPAALEAGVRHHDWWVYLVASGAGARIVIDPEPGVLYRQHEGNHMGAHRDARGALARLQALRGGVWNDWADRNCRALAEVEGVLTPEARALLGRFVEIRAETRGIGRARALRAAGIHRQSRSGDVVLAAMAALGWM
jgi:glycosyltransferase involved in cell wall biosynthesis